MKKKLVLNKESLRNLTSAEMGQAAGGGDSLLTGTSIIIAPHPPIVIPNPLSAVASGCDTRTSILHDRLSPVGIVIGS